MSILLAPMSFLFFWVVCWARHCCCFTLRMIYIPPSNTRYLSPSISSLYLLDISWPERRQFRSWRERAKRKENRTDTINLLKDSIGIYTFAHVRSRTYRYIKYGVCTERVPYHWIERKKRDERKGAKNGKASSNKSRFLVWRRHDEIFSIQLWDASFFFYRYIFIYILRSFFFCSIRCVKKEKKSTHFLYRYAQRIYTLMYITKIK